MAATVTMRRGRGLAWVAGLVLAFLHVPILLVFLYAFTTEEASFRFPPPGLTTRWFEVAARNHLLRTRGYDPARELASKLEARLADGPINT